MVVHDRVTELAEIDRLDLWLSAICRRVAAGYRRRAGHRNELLGCEPAVEEAGVDAPEDGLGANLQQQLALVRRALNRLDDESRDLLALADVGQMPLTELARLVDHDRKTVRKRLDHARRRVTRLVAQTDDPGRAGPQGPPLRITRATSPVMKAQAARGREAGCAEGLEVLHVSPGRNVGVIGNVAIGTRAGAITPEMALGPRARHSTGITDGRDRSMLNTPKLPDAT